MKKKVVAGLAVAMAVVIGVGSYLFFQVDAQGILTGLEEKVTDKVNDNEKFQIVEIVPDGSMGEIGCLVKNDEQDLVQAWMNDYIAKYREEDASIQNTKDVRLKCVDQLQKAYAYAIGDPASKPMTMEQEYKEAYFLTDIEDTENPENWKTLEFSQKNYEQARLKGTYVADTEGKGAYEINVDYFDYSSKTGAYEVVFGTTERTDKKDEKIYHTPYHVIKVENDTQIMGEAGVDETQDLYYIQSYTYKGIGQEGAAYAAIPDSKKPYYYVGENGTYTFLQDEDLLENDVEIGRIYYKFGLENHDWFRTKVLSSNDSDRLDIEVSTISESELSKTENVEKIEKADFIYVCGDIEKSEKSEKKYQQPSKVWDAIRGVVTDLKKKTPCMIEASTKVWEQCETYKDKDKDGYSGQADYVKENVYIYESQKPEEEKRHAFFENFEEKIDDVSGLGEVESLVKQENLLRSGDEKLSTDLTRAFLLQYIIDYSHRRKLGEKDSFRVLEIQPTMAHSADTTGFELTTEKVAQWAGVSKDTKIVIDSMSTAEFIGKIDDLNAEYDLIYFGADISNLNTKSGKTVYNDPRMNGLIYTHTGDLILGKIMLTGMMDVDYGGAFTFRDEEQKPYARTVKNGTYEGYLLHNDGDLYKDVFSSRTIYENGVLRQNFLKPYNQTQYWYSVGLGGKFGGKYDKWDLCGDLGVYRYSGNDITKTKKSDLLEYVGANYPVVVSDALYATDENGKKSVNTSAVDNTSYLYQFLDEVKNKESVYSVQQAKSENSNIGSYLNLPKLKLLYFDPDTPEGAMETYEGIDTAAGSSFEDKSMMKIDTSNVASGTYTAKIGFYLDSTVNASAGSTYSPKFYLDLNADGKFLESGEDGSSEQMSCVIYNVDTDTEAEAPKDEKGNYQLLSGVRYRLEREIPSTYLGVLTWKLEMVQVANSKVRTSDVQYTKVDGVGEEEVVNVLQITSTQKNKLDLSTNNTMQNYFNEVRSTTGLNFHITTISGAEFGNQTSSDAESFYKAYLEEYDMLILGFADVYSDIDNSNHAVDAINYFISLGKSVLFSHDVTSFVNISPKHIFKDGHIKGLSNDSDLDIPKQWGYDMNSAFRNLLAMDRYGVTADTDYTASKELKAQGNLLRQQQHLTVNVEKGKAEVNQGYLHYYPRKDIFGNELDEPSLRYGDDYDAKKTKLGYYTTRGITEGTLSSERDIAYAANTYNSENGTAQAYGQTHGLTYGILNQYAKVISYTENNGSPYWNFKNGPMKGNVDGQVNALVTKENDGLITHYPYEIGSEFRSAETHYQYYQLHMDQDVDGDDSGDVVVWYCLSDDADDSTSDEGKVYRNSKNDVRNNYYIYNIGNVTYTGMGHSGLDSSDSNNLEAKLLVNTIVAAYKAGVENPNIKILETSDKSSSEKKYEYITYDITYDDTVSSTALTNDVDFYFTISDPNLTPSQKTMTVKFTYNNGTEDVALDASQLEVVDVTTNTPVTGNYTDGHVYKATLKDAAGKLAELEKTGNGSLEIKAKLNSSFDYYGRHESHDAVTSLTILKMSLFELN